MSRTQNEIKKARSNVRLKKKIPRTAPGKVKIRKREKTIKNWTLQDAWRQHEHSGGTSSPYPKEKTSHSVNTRGEKKKKGKGLGQETGIYIKIGWSRDERRA